MKKKERYLPFDVLLMLSENLFSLLFFFLFRGISLFVAWVQMEFTVEMEANWWGVLLGGMVGAAHALIEDEAMR